MSGHDGGAKRLFCVTKSKLGYVLSVQGAPMACHNCGKGFREKETACSRWTGRRTVYYCGRCAERLTIVVAA